MRELPFFFPFLQQLVATLPMHAGGQLMWTTCEHTNFRLSNVIYRMYF